jgi:hypothetical protein
LTTAVERFPRLRQSRLATFDRCALSAKFEEDYRTGFSGHPQARGTMFHRFAAEALRTMARQQETQIPTEEAIQILNEVIRQADIDKECPSCQKPITKKEQGRIFCDEGHEHASDFVNLPAEQIKDLRWIVVKWANDNAFDIENLVEIEQRLEAPIRCQDAEVNIIERVLTGQLDAWFVTGPEDDEAIVLDWKDTWMLPAPKEVGFDGYFQQRFYAWLIMQLYPQIQKVTLREFYVRYSEPREATVWRVDMEDVESELAALVERFDRAWTEENFPPAPGQHCQFCPRPSACPIFAGVRGEGAITSDEMARKVAAEAMVVRSALDDRTKSLKAWASAHGPVEISDHKGRRVWGFQPSTRTSRPSQEEVEQAMSVGIDPVTLFKTSQTTRFAPHIPKEPEDMPDDAALIQALEESIEQQKKK